MENRKQRSKQLMPLSHEHLDGMDFVNRIRSSVDSTPMAVLSAYTCWYWKQHIRPHFFQEEKILLPLMPADHPFSKKLKDEHAYIRDLIISLDQDADKHTFKNLCDLIEAHIRFEEKEFFSYLEENIEIEKLNDAFEKIESHPLGHGEWKNKFWEKAV